MLDILQQIRDLFYSWNPNESISDIDILPASGSERRYFRVHGSTKSYIATYNTNVKENLTFLEFTKHFLHLNLPVPEIYKINGGYTLYLQEDLGSDTLLNVLEAKGHTDEVYALYQKTLNELARIQIEGGQNLDYDLCLTNKEFGKQAILNDLLYFKYYFLDTLQYPYDKQALLDDFEALASYLTFTEGKHFLFRDFQSRNVMVKDSEVFFIDYQGGMRGALQYDVASLLWQAKANLPEAWKERLLQHYIDSANTLLPQPIDPNIFTGQYYGYVLIRLLQVLGAYGFRGLFERKAHFLSSIPLALKNLRWFRENQKIGIKLNEFEKVLHHVVSDEVIAEFESVRATADTPLVVKICSFSFKKGLPTDDTDNGGGFVFDCRGILNPGRFAEYKQLTGRDKPVKDFLEQQTKMPEFLNSVFDLVDISVEDYIKRNFDSLMVSFGCTGGQHRSVYAADALARHLRNKFGVAVELSHVVQDAKNWINI